MFHILDPKCQPTKGTKYSAAIDLYTRTDITIPAGETAKVPLGVSLDQNNPLISVYSPDHYIQLEPRSSIRAKGLQAGTGIIDLDFIPNCRLNKQLKDGQCMYFKPKLKE